MRNEVVIYTDGGSRGNGKEGNIGGWGYTMDECGLLKEDYSWEKNTTNNKMELRAIIEALKALSVTNRKVRVFSDSQYVIKGINEWSHGWIRKGWVTSSEKPVKNKELWIELLELKKKAFDIEFIWVKGHADSEGNNRADELANIAMDNGEIEVNGVG